MYKKLDGKNVVINNDILSKASDSYAVEKDNKKDIFLSGGGVLTLKQNLDLGGLIFDKDNHYTLDGSSFSYKGAGVDIGKGTTVDWKIKGVKNDNLHKIGEGTLNVHLSQGNNLKIGNGTVNRPVLVPCIF
ncbi:hypothetical protein RN043_004359 [Salmonella enterica]|nr:hypothetical protein [Salmonella enterica]